MYKSERLLTNKCFLWENERRMQQERIANEKPTALSHEGSRKSKRKIGVSVELTEEATSFLANLAER